MAIPTNENWQTGKNVLGCNEYMFVNQLYCDVNFKVGTAGVNVKAHKYVLASRSSVFAAMLYGSLLEVSDAIAVPDIEPEVFGVLLKFMYFEAKIINENNVIGALYAAEKYGVSDLVDICRSYLESNIGESTVCVIMENARIFNMADLLSKCINFIFHCECASKRIFSSPGFLDLSRKCLKALVESDDLILDETFIYRSLIRWARYNCEKEQKDNADLKQLREIMGDLIYDIRFPTMSLEKFWKDIVPDGVLLSEEKIQISEQIIGRCVQNPVFNTSYRNYSKRKICEIFRNTSESTEYSWMPQSNINGFPLPLGPNV